MGFDVQGILFWGKFPLRDFKAWHSVSNSNETLSCLEDPFGLTKCCKGKFIWVK